MIRYSSKHDMFSTSDINGPIFHRIENGQRSEYNAPAGRAYFFASKHVHDSPWLAIIDDFGNLVRVQA